MIKINVKREVCGKCDKTVYASEEMTAVGKKWHKACFRCAEPSCNMSLTLLTFLGHNGSIYCKTHVPKPKATQVADDVLMQHVRAAPKPVSEGLGNIYKGSADTAPRLAATGVRSEESKHAPASANKPLAPAAAPAVPAPAHEEAPQEEAYQQAYEYDQSANYEEQQQYDQQYDQQQYEQPVEQPVEQPAADDWE